MSKNKEFNRIKLKSLNNTRDLGGQVTVDGRKIKQGLLFRSGKLYKLSRSVADILEGYGISTVIDLRLEIERNEKPDTILKNCVYENCPLVCTATPGITYESKMSKTLVKEGKILTEKYSTPDNYMVEMYKNMVTDEQSLQALKKFFDILLKAEGAVLFHCNSGKDRVGICSMLLESVLGVSDERIIANYMISRAFCRLRFVTYRLGLIIAPCTMKFKRFLYCIMRTKKLYLQETIKYLEEKYGSILDFCKNVLGLTDENVSVLKNKYLEA